MLALYTLPSLIINAARAYTLLAVHTCMLSEPCTADSTRHELIMYKLIITFMLEELELEIVTGNNRVDWLLIYLFIYLLD